MTVKMMVTSEVIAVVKKENIFCFELPWLCTALQLHDLKLKQLGKLAQKSFASPTKTRSKSNTITGNIDA